MMVEIEKQRISKILELHNSINIYLTKSLDNAIRIGQILVEQKKSLRHGEFHRWISANLPFSDRTARRYISLYEHKDSLKTDSVSDLTSAYELIASDCRTEDTLDAEKTILRLREKYGIDDIPTKEQRERDINELNACIDIKRLIELRDVYHDYHSRTTAFKLEIEREMGFLLKCC